MIVFIANILVYSKTKVDHNRHQRIVHKLFREEKLCSKFSKCQIWLNCLAFLQLLMPKECVLVGPANIGVVKCWMRPT